MFGRPPAVLYYMRFEVVFKKDKLKGMESIFKMTASLLKAKNQNFQVLFLYLPDEEHIRIIVMREEAPILIVLFKDLFYKIASYSKSSNEESAMMGFQFKDGLQFIEEVLIFLKEDQSSTMILEEENSIFMKIGKEKDFRYFEIKNKSRCRKIEIEKPSTKEEELIRYFWIDGVSKPESSFKIAMGFIIQMMKFASKCKTAYPIQTLENKLLDFYIRLEEENKGKGILSVQSKQSKINSSGLINQNEGPKNKEYHYEIKIDDCQLLIQALKPESHFVINQQKSIAVIFNQDNLYQCQISLSNLIKFVDSTQDPQLKMEM